MNLQLHGLRRDPSGLGGPPGIDLPFHGTGEGGQQLTDLSAVGDAGFVILEIVFSGDLSHAEFHAVLAAVEQTLKGVRSLKLDEIVGVLLDVFTVHQTAGKLKHLDAELGAVQDLQGPLRGDLAGVIVVIAEDQFLGETAEKPGLLHRQRRAHGGHGVVEPRLVQGHHVQVALAQDDVGPLGLFGQVQSVQHPALAVCKGFGGVHILGLGLVQHPAAEAHHVAPHVDHRQDQPVAELVVYVPVLSADGQACPDQLVLGIAPGGHGGQQGVPAVRRGPHAEAHGDPPVDLPPVQIVPDGLALRGLEGLIVPPGGVPVQLQHPAAELLRAVAGLLRHRDVGPLGQKPHRVGIGQILDVHDEVDDAAALFAAEAVIKLLVRQHMEGGGLFVVEGAAAPEAASLGRQGHIGAHHIHDIVPGDQLVQKALGKRHGCTSFVYFCVCSR